MEDEEYLEKLETGLYENGAMGLVAAIGDCIRAEGISKMAKKMGVSREGLYKSFSGRRKPNIETVLNALDGLGMRIDIRPKLRVKRHSKR